MVLVPRGQPDPQRAPRSSEVVQQDFVGKELPDRAPQHPADACALLVEANSKGELASGGMQGSRSRPPSTGTLRSARASLGPRRAAPAFALPRLPRADHCPPPHARAPVRTMDQRRRPVTRVGTDVSTAPAQQAFSTQRRSAHAISARAVTYPRRHLSTGNRVPHRRGPGLPLLIAAFRCLAAEIWNPCIPRREFPFAVGFHEQVHLRPLNAEVHDPEVLFRRGPAAPAFAASGAR